MSGQTPTPVANDFTIDNLSQTVDNITAVTIVPKEGKSTGSITIYYNSSEALPTAVGTYAVTFDVAATEGWNAASGLIAGTLTINAGGGDSNTTIGQTITITGAQIYLTDTGGNILGSYTGNAANISLENANVSGSITNGKLNLTVAAPSPEHIAVFKATNPMADLFVGEPADMEFFLLPYQWEAFPITEDSTGRSLMVIRFREDQIGNGNHLVIYASKAGTMTVPTFADLGSFNVVPGWNFIEIIPGEGFRNIIPGDDYKWYVIVD